MLTRRPSPSVVGIAVTGLTLTACTVAPGQGLSGPSTTTAEFAACDATAPEPSRTRLLPRELTASDATADTERFGTIPVDGPLVLVDAGDLVLTHGTLGAGNGFEGMTAQTEGDLPVAEEGARVPVTLQVLDSAESGRRTTFVEAHVATGEPVTWEEAPELLISTDGGDGAFVATGGPAPAESEYDALIRTSIDAFVTADGTPADCVLRRPAPGAEIDSVTFGTGWGDGAYPVFVGRDAAGTVVSVVEWGLITPWEWSGLPGTPPEHA